ncbi:hypothetical protein TCAL_10400 [Tigriopus californicus]|uniref:MD-2-related lipid-recognition domain-containing protein n=1 Tax=Tigriopus californicus TaxID=6832 RepID=A0A553NNI0_TIGCA|nr:NPC intracellular cholesterol transporter 2-like [Tigriopus californicus]TRY66976.1 hypothetical protein TCAL_10400 [Tigriopus californicus]|eukprot:TCALIF_10400-PA protein Name:"Similar to NPC2 Epididymal secretory protein E1 (Bos taurus)" AED:0.00 eAED:0.00 QI:119/1/1/1/0.66/0.75/4/118/162
MSRGAMFILFAFLTLSSFQSALGGSLLFDDCPSGSSGEVLDVRVTDCSEDFCDLVLGTKVMVEIDFIPSASLETLNTEVYGIISGVYNKYEDVPKDTCSTLANGFACPLEAGVMATYAFEADVREEYPAIPSITVEWSLKDDQDNSEICFQALAALIEGLPK